MLPMDFEISDLPPPETVQGLWQSVGSARDATRRQAVPSGLLFQADFRAPRKHVRFGRAKGQLVCLSALNLPSHAAFTNTEFGVFRNVEDVRKPTVCRVAFGPDLHAIRQPVHGFREFYLLREHGTAGIKLLSEYVGGKGDGAAGMLFLAQADRDWPRS